MKDCIKIPEYVRVQEVNLMLSSPNKEQEYQDFVKVCEHYFQANGLYQNKFFDFYRLFGGQRLSSESPKHERLYVFFNQKQWFFEDTKSHNAFVRLRREHMAKMGLEHGSVVEIDFYEVSPKQTE